VDDVKKVCFLNLKILRNQSILLKNNEKEKGANMNPKKSYLGIGLFLLIGVIPSISFAQIDWLKYSGNPILQAGEHPSWEDEEIRCPIVIMDAGVYKMWYSGQTYVAGLPEDLSRIGYATSTDGFNWTKFALNPVLDAGVPGTWEDGGVDDPTVIKDDGIYMLWYTGVSFPAPLGTEEGVTGIGYAFSDDGISWTKYSENPVLGPGLLGCWDDQYVDDATVIKDGDVLKMWYMGFGSNHPDSSIGYANSSDGITWEKYPTPVIENGSEPIVIKKGGIYRMWYASETGIQYAMSWDGIVWEKYALPVLTKGESGSWDDEVVTDPAVLKDDSTYKMWYAGEGSGPPYGGIGVATSSFLAKKCLVKAGKTDNSDMILILGQMSAAVDDFNDANYVQVIIDSNDMVNPLILTFPINDKAFKNDKYNYARTENTSKRLFKYDTKTGKFTFMAKNVDLSGLGCPLTIEIMVGNYVGVGEVDEDVVNGPIRLIPIQLMREVKDTLRVDKNPKLTSGKKPSTDSLSVMGTITLKNTCNLTVEVVTITWGTQTFTIPEGSFKFKKNTFTCKNVKVVEGGIVSAKFDFVKCSFTIAIKKAAIQSKSGTVNFGIAFCSFNESVEVEL